MLRLRNLHNCRRSPRFIPLLKRKNLTTSHLMNVSSQHLRSLQKNVKETTKYKPQSKAPRSLAKSTSDGYMPRTSVSPEELLSLSPELRNKVREAISTKRMPIVHSKLNAIKEDNQLPFPETAPDQEPDSSTPNIPIIIPDLYKAYLNSLDSGQKPEVLTVAKESHALRSIIF